MLSKLIIPVIDTENSTFETDVKMSNEEFRYLQEQALIEKNNINKGIRNYRNTDEHISNTTKYNTFKSECLFLTPRKEEINEDFFINLFDRENAFLLLININPNDMHNNAEEEIKFWADDSDRILNDYTLDDRTRIKALPIKTLGIELNGEDYNLINCKLIENRSDRKFPFYYIILVEKISKN
jgi:hypothetical protein